MPEALKRVVRLDSSPINQAYYTSEGYLMDKPILTSIGVFEYANPDGSVRRELRLPEEVFDPESLASYKGKVVVITHDAGLITKDNVSDEGIGTILSEGYRDGDDVRAEIVIHDTDEMKHSRLKELSLGYNLDLDETPGTWHGQKYDAIQRNIRINHLALVREARAGDQARLNIDGRDPVLKGGKVMSKKTRKAKRSDGVLSPEELKKAIAEYKARRAKKTDEEEVAPVKTKKAPVIADADDDDKIIAPAAQADGEELEEQVQAVKDRKDRRDEEDAPQNMKQANKLITDQDEDIGVLLDIIDTLLAERDFDEADDPEEIVEDEDDEDPNLVEDEDEDPDLVEDEDEEEPDLEEDEDDEDLVEEDEDDEELVEDEDEEEDLELDCYKDEEDEELVEDEDDDLIPNRTKLNADGIDRLVRQRVQIGMLGKELNLDGLENMSARKAKKKIIKAVRPNVRLDGKSTAYINAMFACAADDIKRSKRKDTKYQKKQMFNADSRSYRSRPKKGSSEARRNAMIKRHSKSN